MSKPGFLFGEADESSYNIMDVLAVVFSYIGAIIGGMISGIVAIVGVYWTINYERNKDREEKRIDHMPMLTVKADYQELKEGEVSPWGGGYIRLPFNVDYELLEESFDGFQRLKKELLAEIEAEREENAGEDAEMQAEYKKCLSIIEDCDITTADGMAFLLKLSFEHERDTLDLETEREFELVIDSLEQMEELGYCELIPLQKKKSVFRSRKKRRLYSKLQTKENVHGRENFPN